MDLNGKRAIVFGGTSGIGLAAVQQFEAAGTQVIACSRSEDNIATARDATGDNVTFEKIDVLDRDALTALFEANTGFDILISAATGGERASGPFLKMDLDGFQGSFRKLWGYANTVLLGTEHMADDGSIVLVSGFPARKANPGSSAIATVGGAVGQFARAIAPEIAPRRINIVSPGVIDTPMFPVGGDARDTFLSRATENMLIKRAGLAAEVAAAIVFCAHNDYMTGGTIDVDGGATLP